jgi:DNA gyrase/topoisomerase IV subunit A
LTGLEVEKVDAEYRELLETIADLLDILAREDRACSASSKPSCRPSRKSMPPRA